MTAPSELMTRPGATAPGTTAPPAGGSRLMEMTKTVDGKLAVLRPAGRLNMVAAPALKTVVEQTLADGQNRIVVDLTETTFVDSSGLGALIAGLKAARAAGGDLRISDVPEQVMTVLRLTNLDRVLRAHPSVADASRDW